MNTAASAYLERSGEKSAFINFRNPKTGDEVSVRTDDPKADQYAEAGWQRIGLTTKQLASGDPGTIFGTGTDIVTDRKTREVVGGAENLISSVDRIEGLISKMDQSALGAPGTVSKLVDNVSNAVVGFSEMMGGSAQIGDRAVAEEALLNANLYRDAFSGAASQSAALQANAIGLAYSLARAANPDGRISDMDVRHQLQRVQLTSSSKTQILSAITEVRREIMVNTANHLRVNGYTRNNEGKAYYDSLMEKIEKIDGVVGEPEGNVPKISSDAEYEAFLENDDFPRGTIFIDPDGNRRIKP